MHDNDDYVFAPDDAPLVPDSCGGDVEDVVFDEEGTLPAVRATSPAIEATLTAPGGVVATEAFRWRRPCSLGVLDGSWNLSFRPKRNVLFGSLRGPMRLEARSGVLRASGDAYFKSFVIGPVAEAGRVAEATTRFQPPEELEFTTGITRPAVLFRRNWYPHYPFDEYRWYFRSTGCSYIGGALQINFRRHIWDSTDQEFAGTDSGWMRFTCEQSIFRSFVLPQPTVQMTGDAMIGGTEYTVTATKTSPYYRGAVVEVDVMENRSFPTTAAGQTFAGIYRTAGIDLAVRMSNSNVPADAQLTTAELHSLLSTWRDIPNIANTWRTWLLIGSRRSGSNTFGIMFDQDAPHREGAVGFYDATMGNGATLVPSARNQDLGDVPAAFLRTLVHEIGHAFNLFHPKHDVHDPAIGTTTMNQTGDVISFATTSNQYPNNISWSFNDHNRTSLIHSPDPQIAPGWKEFGWGHGSAFGGVPTPFDALGLEPRDRTPALVLELGLPDQAVAGEFLSAEITVTNESAETVLVHESLNLAEGHVELEVKTPFGEMLEVRDVVVACGGHDTVELAPGESISQSVQVFYTNHGHTFATPGSYSVRASMAAADGSTSRVVSDWHTITITPPSNAAQRKRADLTLDPGVGLSFALSDFGADDNCAQALEELAKADDETGAAASLVLANSYGQQFRDLRSGKIVRSRKNREAAEAMADALAHGSLDKVYELAQAVMPAGVAKTEIRAWLEDGAEG